MQLPESTWMTHETIDDLRSSDLTPPDTKYTKRDAEALRRHPTKNLLLQHCNHKQQLTFGHDFY